MASDSRFDSIMISRARTMKIEELEKELEEEVAQFKSTNKSGIQLDSVKLSRAKRDRELERIVAFKPTFATPQTFRNTLRYERRKNQAELFKVLSQTDLAEFILNSLKTESAKLKNQSLQLSLRWRRYISGQLQSDLELNLATKQYEIDKAVKGLKSFEEAQLVKEEWKGSLKPADIVLVMKSLLLRGGMLRTYHQLRTKLRLFPSSKLVRGKSRAKSTRGSIIKDRMPSVIKQDNPLKPPGPPKARRGIITEAPLVLKKERNDLLGKELLNYLNESKSSLSEKIETGPLVEDVLPQYSTRKESFMPRLLLLARRYKIVIPEQMKTAADELEFFNSTHSVFRAHLLVQNESWSFIDGTSHNKQKSVLQKPDWQLSEVVPDPTQVDAVRSFAHLSETCLSDKVLESCADFLNVKNAPKISMWLQRQVEELTSVSKTIITETGRSRTITKKRKQDMIRDAWAKVYQTISEKEDAQPLDQVGDSIKKEASYDFVRSYQLLGLADGANSDMIVKSAQKDPSIASGALLSYLHLRYLDIRQQKLVCLAQLNFIISAHRSAVKIQEAFEKISNGEETDFYLESYKQKITYGYQTIDVFDRSGQQIMHQDAVDRLKKLEKLIIYLASHYCLHDEECVDHTEVLSQIWNGITRIIKQKVSRCELLLDSLLNTDDSKTLTSIKEKIGQLLTFDFNHDLKASHCQVHLQAHATLLEKQNKLLLLLRNETISEFRQHTDTAVLGPTSSFMTDSFTNKTENRLCEINPFMGKTFGILEEISNVNSILFDNWEVEPTTLKKVSNAIQVTNFALDKMSLGMNGEGKISFSPQVFKDFLDANLSEKELEDESLNLSVAEMGMLLKTTQLFYNLQENLNETEILSDLYMGLADTLSFSRCHLFLRCITPSLNQSGNIRTEKSFRNIPVDDKSVDRFKPANYNLAVYDFDETVPKGISFHDTSSVLDIALNAKRLQKLTLITKLQMLHKQLLECSIRLTSVIRLWPKDENITGESRSESKPTGTHNETATVTTSHENKGAHSFAELFISLQWERFGPRARFLEYFQSADPSANVDNLRIEGLTVLCHEIENVIEELSCRVTILEQTARIMWILNSGFWEGGFGSDHFEIGQSLKLDPEQKDLLTSDSDGFNNLFLLPHFSAIMNAGKKLPQEELLKSLDVWSSSISCLADLIMIFTAKSRIGGFGGTAKGSWGGPEGINHQLLELRREMKKSDIAQTSRLLLATRQQNLLEFETAGARLFERLVKCGKYKAASILQSSLAALDRLKLSEKCCFSQIPWIDIETAFRQAFANLISADFSLANSEAISLGVLVEEVLVECEDTIGVRRKNTDRGVEKFLHLIGRKSITAMKSQPRAVSVLKALEQGQAIVGRLRAHDKLEILEPDEAALFAVTFLQRTLQLMKLRARWGARRLKISNIFKDAAVLRDYETLYRSEVLLPVVRAISKNQNIPMKRLRGVADEDCLIYKLLPKVSRLEIMACEVARLAELELYESIQFERHKLQKTRTKNAEAGIKQGSRKPPKFRSWVNEYLREKGLSSEIAHEFENRLEDDWRDHEKVLLAAIGNIAKDFKSANTKNLDLAPSCDQFRISEIHRGQVAQLSKLTAQNIKLKEQIAEIRDEEYQKAIEHYRPLVTAQYAAMLKMSNKLNLYQHSMHLQLQNTVEEIKQEAFNQISTKPGSSENIEIMSEEKDFTSWHIIQRHFLRMHLMTQKARHEVVVKKTQDEALFWKEKFQKLQKASDEMIEQFQVEKTVQNEMIQNYNEKIESIDMVKRSRFHQEQPSTEKSINYREAKVEEIRQAALAEARKIIESKDADLRRLEEQLVAQNKRFDTLSARQAKMMKETRQELEAEREMKLDAFHNVKRLKSHLNCLENEEDTGFSDNPRQSERLTIPSHFGLTQRSQTSLGYYRESKKGSQTSLRPRPKSSFEKREETERISRVSKEANRVTRPKTAGKDSKLKTIYSNKMLPLQSSSQVFSEEARKSAPNSRNGSNTDTRDEDTVAPIPVVDPESRSSRRPRTSVFGQRPSQS